MALTPEQIQANLSANYMAVKPTLVGDKAVDAKRQQQIFANLQKGYNANKAPFADRQAYDTAYGYGTKSAGEKVLLDTFYNTINPITHNTPATTASRKAVWGDLMNTASNIPKYEEPKYVATNPNIVKTVETKNPDGSITTSIQRKDGKIYNTTKMPSGGTVNTITNAFPNQKVGIANATPNKPSTSLAPATPNKPVSTKTPEQIAQDNTDWAKGTGAYATTTSSTPTPTTTTPDLVYTPKAPAPKVDTTVTPYKPTDVNILNANEESLQKAKYDALLSSKNQDIKNAQDEYNKGLKVLKMTNENIRRLYGIDEKGNIDPTNTTSLAYTQKAALDDYKRVKEDLLSGYTGTRLNNVKAQTFAILAQRNITDASKVSPELLMQLSGEIGAAAMNDIYQAKEKTTNDIEARKKEVQMKLDSLRESGLIKTNEFEVASETLRASTEKLKQSINKQFSNDIFGLIDLKNTKNEARSTDVINTIQKFGAQLGITGKGLMALNDYVGRYKNSADALTGMLADLGDPNSNLYKSITDAEQRTSMSAALQQQQKLELAAANKKSTATGSSMTWGLPARTYLSSSFINSVKNGLGEVVAKPEMKNLANKIADDYYKSQGQDIPKGPDGFMDDQKVREVPTDYAVKWVSDNLSPDKLTNDLMSVGLGMFPEVAKSVSGNTLTE